MELVGLILTIKAGYFIWWLLSRAFSVTVTAAITKRRLDETEKQLVISPFTGDIFAIIVFFDLLFKGLELLYTFLLEKTFVYLYKVTISTMNTLEAKTIQVVENPKLIWPSRKEDNNSLRGAISEVKQSENDHGK